MSRRKARESAGGGEEVVRDVRVNVVQRQLSTQRRRLTGVILEPVLIPLFDHAARQIQLLSFWGSEFINFHLLRLLRNVKVNGFPERINDTFVRQCFMVVAADFPGKQKLENKKGATKDEKAIVISAELWKKVSGQTEQAEVAGMSGMVTSAAKEYLEAFEHYQVYAICQHWAYVVTKAYTAATKRISEMVVRKLSEFIRAEAFGGEESKSSGVRVTGKFADASDDDVTMATRQIVDEIYENEKDLCGLDRIGPGRAHLEHRLKTTADNTVLHYEILQRLPGLAEERKADLEKKKKTRKMKSSSGEMKSYSIAPYCDDYKKSFVEYHKQSLSKYLRAVYNGGAAKDFATKNVKSALRRMMTAGGWLRARDGRYIDLSSLFEVETGYYAKDEWRASLTFKCDGLDVHRIWERPFIKETMMSAEEAESYWSFELGRRFAESAAPVKEKKSSELFYSTDVVAFNNGEYGLYSSSIWSEKICLASTSPEGTPELEQIVAVDPGEKGIFHLFPCNKDTFDGSPGADEGPRKGVSLSYNECEDRCRSGPSDRSDAAKVLAAKMSRCHLRTVDLALFLKNLPVNSSLVTEAIEIFGSNDARLNRSLRMSRTQSFYAKIVDELFPKDCIVAMGDGNINASRSRAPKLIRMISKVRRTVMVKEPYTSRRCSVCRDRGTPEEPTKDLVAVFPDHQKKKKGERRRSRKQRKSGIHGLRQCPHCRRTWNRDFNAARNIAYAAIYEWYFGQRPDYLLNPKHPPTGFPTARNSPKPAANPLVKKALRKEKRLACKVVQEASGKPPTGCEGRGKFTDWRDERAASRAAKAALKAMAAELARAAPAAEARNSPTPAAAASTRVALALRLHPGSRDDEEPNPDNPNQQHRLS